MRPFPFLIAAGLVLAACTDGLDFDMRGRVGGLDTSASAAGVQPTTERPAADARGVISYPGYQVAVAQNGDTVAGMATRLGLDPAELARFNGLRQDAALRRGEVLALPRRVAEPATTGSGTDIAAIAGAAIDRAEGDPIPAATPAVPEGIEPIRHRVGRGETAFSIARLYSVSPRALAEWNGLGPDLAVREGQFLMIPVPVEQARAPGPSGRTTPLPGSGSETPVPPLAATPLPEDDTGAVEVPEGPDLSRTTAATDATALAMPVSGRISRSFQRGRHDGITFTADAGASVTAAESGQVVIVTETTDQVQVAIVQHPSGLMTVYGNVADLRVARGDRVRRGQRLASVAPGDTPFLYFEVRQGAEPVDPIDYLQ